MRRPAGGWPLGVAVAVGALALAAPARAHLVQTGLGPFYDGITHLAVSPADLLAVIAVALLAGLGGAGRGRLLAAALSVAWLAGGLVGLLAPREVALPVATALLLLVLGASVAANVAVPRPLAAVLVVVAGLVLGGLNGSALRAAGGGWLGLFGIVAAVSVIVCLMSAATVTAGASWQRIAVRVAGSWIAAIALLMLGWGFAG